MRAISLGTTPICEFCSDKMAFEARLCERCKRMFGRLCKQCAQTAPCPDCGARLVDPNKVFPWSLFAAIHDGRVDEVERLVSENKPDLERLKNPSGWSPLHAAVRSENDATGTCRVLRKAGASPSGRDAQGSTALIVAVKLRNWTKELLGLLASSVNEQDNSGRTALMFAAKGGSGWGPEKGNVAIARALLAVGASASSATSTGRLHSPMLKTQTRLAKTRAWSNFLRKP